MFIAHIGIKRVQTLCFGLLYSVLAVGHAGQRRSSLHWECWRQKIIYYLTISDSFITIKRGNQHIHKEIWNSTLLCKRLLFWQSICSACPQTHSIWAVFSRWKKNKIRSSRWTQNVHYSVCFDCLYVTFSLCSCTVSLHSFSSASPTANSKLEKFKS